MPFFVAIVQVQGHCYKNAAHTTANTNFKQSFCRVVSSILNVRWRSGRISTRGRWRTRWLSCRLACQLACGGSSRASRRLTSGTSRRLTSRSPSRACRWLASRLPRGLPSRRMREDSQWAGQSQRNSFGKATRITHRNHNNEEYGSIAGRRSRSQP
jgi:hypothetical protein